MSPDRVRTPRNPRTVGCRVVARAHRHQRGRVYQVAHTRFNKENHISYFLPNPERKFTFCGVVADPQHFRNKFPKWNYETFMCYNIFTHFIFSSSPRKKSHILRSRCVVTIFPQRVSKMELYPMRETW